MDNVNIVNIEDKLTEMGMSLSETQLQEIKIHFELVEKNSRDSNPASQTSVKTEPDMDTAPPTPKIARKVSANYLVFISLNNFHSESPIGTKGNKFSHHPKVDSIWFCCIWPKSSASDLSKANIVTSS